MNNPARKSLDSQIYGHGFYRGLTQGSAGSSAQQVVPLVLELVAPKSVVDVGCGVGTWLAEFVGRGIEDVCGVDGHGHVDLLEISPSKYVRADVGSTIPVDRRFDLAVCLEVAEHLQPKHAEGLVRNLVALSPVVLFSAAIPYQGGTGHLNEQWPTYWLDIFRCHGYVVVDALRKATWDNELVAFYYRQNMLIFASAEALRENPRLEAAYSCTDVRQLSVVIPELYLQHASRAATFRRIARVVPAPARRLLRSFVTRRGAE